jgi:hypothetical protein
MDELTRPVFDQLLEVELGESEAGIKVSGLVVHRNAEGVIYCCHSPLDNGPVHCDLCETPGFKVWMS